MRSMCARLAAAFDAAGWGDREVSQLLGYSNQTTISNVRRGKTFLDTERLATLGALTVRRQARTNLHWILTGDGQPFLAAGSDQTLAQALSTVALNSLHS